MRFAAVFLNHIVAGELGAGGRKSGYSVSTMLWKERDLGEINGYSFGVGEVG
jgi:hypothetical protein